MVCLSVTLLYYRVTCLGFCDGRVCNEKGAPFGPDPVSWVSKEAQCPVESPHKHSFPVLVLALGFLRILWPPTLWLCLCVCERAFT